MYISLAQILFEKQMRLNLSILPFCEVILEFITKMQKCRKCNSNPSKIFVLTLSSSVFLQELYLWQEKVKHLYFFQITPYNMTKWVNKEIRGFKGKNRKIKWIFDWVFTLFLDPLNHNKTEKLQVSVQLIHKAFSIL